MEYSGAHGTQIARPTNDNVPLCFAVEPIHDDFIFTGRRLPVRPYPLPCQRPGVAAAYLFLQKLPAPFGPLTQMWIEFEQHQLRWTGAGGAPALWRSSEVSSRAFCPVCGSTLGAVDDAATLAIAVGTLDQLPDHGIAPEFHSFSDELPLWWPLPEVAAAPAKMPSPAASPVL